MFPDVMLVMVSDRKKSAMKIQKALTKSGCAIQARIGLHEAAKTCSNAALMILQLTGAKKETAELRKSLNAIAGVRAKLFDPKKF